MFVMLVACLLTTLPLLHAATITSLLACLVDCSVADVFVRCPCRRKGKQPWQLATLELETPLTQRSLKIGE
jgi:hypothetical protein